MGIYEHLFDRLFVGVVALVFVIEILNNLDGVYYEKTNSFIYLRRGNTYAIGSIHGFPHIINEFLQLGVVCRNIISNFSKYRMTKCHNR